jgi:hypothetical protein
MITVGVQTTGTAASGTTIAVTLPTYVAGDALLLLVSRNQADSTAWTGSGGIAVTEIVQVSRRLAALWVTPDAGATAGTVTTGSIAVGSWACLNLGDVGEGITTSASAGLGSNTTAAMAIPATPLASATGEELALAVAGVNSTAVWATDIDTVVNLAAAPGLFARAVHPTAGVTSMSYTDANRGNEGTTRNEAALSVVIAPTAPTWIPRIITY